MKILLIGNSPSATESKLGKEIDSFPLVVRFNCYKIKGFEEYVGTKTDIWVATDVFQAWHKDYKDVYVCSFNRRPDNKILLKMRERYPDVKTFPEWAWRETIKSIGYNAPSTGAVATTYFMKNYDVYLYGFNFFKDGKHHYGDNHQRGTNHNPEYERPFFNKLLSSGLKVFDNYTLLHERDKGYGSGGGWYKKRIMDTAQKYDCKTLLDYGCGKGALVGEIDGYDPYSGFTNIKDNYDMVFSLDTFEHITDLKETANKINSLNPKIMYHSISNRPAVRILPDGSNAHKTIEGVEWWTKKLNELFPLYEIIETEHHDKNNFTIFIMRRK